MIAPTSDEYDWQPLYFFNFYRLTLITLFIGTFLLELSPYFLGRSSEKLFLVTGWLYFGFAVLSIFITRRRSPAFNVQILIQILVDLLAITFLMHSSGGLNSGLGVLLVVAVAGGSLLTEGRTAFFFAAIASLCALLQVVFTDIYYPYQITNYTHAGTLGIALFATAFLTYVLAQRIRVNEILAKQRGVHLQYLAQLNEQIVQNIQSGIIVIDTEKRIRLFNDAACRLLGLHEHPNGYILAAVAVELAKKVEAWENGQDDGTQLLHPISSDIDIHVVFTKLVRSDTVTTLIVLEDATLMAERARQLKLAALGRLTAGIAHEIRNPLSAITHASQLLAETPNIAQSTDNRLIRIIIKNVTRVNTLVESILGFSRQKGLYTQHFDLKSWLQDFIDEFIMQHSLAEEDIVFYTKQNRLMISFDTVQLYQVIGNLCENGLRYAQGIPKLQFTIGLSEELNKPYLDIKDFGKGMTKEVANQVFEPFFTTSSSGAGLGLYIAREICAVNKASLHLLEYSEKGCCFRIHFTGPKIYNSQ